MAKQCKICGRSDVEFGYRFNKENNKRYIRSDCVNCQREKFKEWQICNVEYNRKRALEYYNKNKAVRDTDRKRRKSLTDEQKSEYRRDKSNRRASFAKHATVKWERDLTSFVYSEAHDLRKNRNEITGFKWNVDHIVPLKGKIVCGLHVWNNFQVIPKIDNILKGNSYDV